jgi:hypothetical protein
VLPAEKKTRYPSGTSPCGCEEEGALASVSWRVPTAVPSVAHSSTPPPLSGAENSRRLSRAATSSESVAESKVFAIRPPA